MSRTALGANPSMTLRQRQQLIEDQQEELVASSHTRSGGTDYASGKPLRLWSVSIYAVPNCPSSLTKFNQ
jgi:hypothetical protein